METARPGYYYSHMTEQWYPVAQQCGERDPYNDAVSDLLVGAAGIVVGPRCGDAIWRGPPYCGAGAANH